MAPSTGDGWQPGEPERSASNPILIRAGRDMEPTDPPPKTRAGPGRREGGGSPNLDPSNPLCPRDRRSPGTGRERSIHPREQSLAAGIPSPLPMFSGVVCPAGEPCHARLPFWLNPRQGPSLRCAPVRLLGIFTLVLKPSRFLWPAGRKPGDEEFEEPTMSFEAFLTYDQPPKRERKPKASATARKGKEPKGKASQRGRKPLDSVENFPPALGNPSGKRQPAQGDRARMEEVSAEAPAVLPGWPFPGLQHQHSPPAARDLMGFFRPNATALPSPEKEEEGGFTGRRTNSKTQVYSGGKRAPLAPMTWPQQHSQALTDHASLLEEKALPQALGQAALQNGTPDQLCHLERAEPGPRQETDEPWRLHCHREFKAETPQENESWREMYLRLQDAREQRLQALTLRIRSAHPPESQGRKTKMIFFKLPAEVPRRPEKLRTVAAAASGEPHFQPAQDPTGSRGSPTSSSSSLDPRAETPAGASVNSARAHRAPAANTSTPTARKIAPLMAKTIKDYKRLTSRR